MPDLTLICQNCHNPFVYSEYEQIQNAKITSTGLINQTPINQSSTIYDLPRGKAGPQPARPAGGSTQPLYCPICASIKASEAKHPPKPKKSN